MNTNVAPEPPEAGTALSPKAAIRSHPLTCAPLWEVPAVCPEGAASGKGTNLYTKYLGLGAHPALDVMYDLI